MPRQSLRAAADCTYLKTLLANRLQFLSLPKPQSRYFEKYSINHKSPNPHIHPHIVPPHYHYHHLITTLSLAVSNCDGASVVFLVLECVCVCVCLQIFSLRRWCFIWCDGVSQTHIAHTLGNTFDVVCCRYHGKCNLWVKRSAWIYGGKISLNRTYFGLPLIFIYSPPLVKVYSSDQPGFLFCPVILTSYFFFFYFILPFLVLSHH